jgi:hypothetical protein
MGKNKGDIEANKIPKKPHLEATKLVANPYLSSPARQSGAGNMPPAVTPPKQDPASRAKEAAEWEAVLAQAEAQGASPTPTPRPPTSLKDLDDDEAILQASGLTFGSTSDSDSDTEANKVNGAKLVMARIGNYIVLRIVPGNPNKPCFQDYKFYCMLTAYKNKDRPDVDLSWMKKYHFETTYGLWYCSQIAMLTYNRKYTTRLYVMAWKEEISDQQAYLLGKVICRKVNDFRVDPDAKSDRPDAPLLVDSDPGKLFWETRGVWNDIISNSAALRRMEEETNREYGKLFFAKHKDLVARYFRKGTLDPETALRLGAPYDWMSLEGQEDWKTSHNISE